MAPHPTQEMRLIVWHSGTTSSHTNPLEIVQLAGCGVRTVYNLNVLSLHHDDFDTVENLNPSGFA
jgi:hypothetical protein